MSFLILLPLDILLVVGVLVAYFSRPRIGGQLAKGLQILLIGILALGCVHTIETLLIVLFRLDPVTSAIAQRLLVACAYIFIIHGLMAMRRAFDE